jgi:TrpR family trp operon transcriptional repressor
MKEINKDEEGWQRFLELCAKVKGAEDFHNLFALFLTYEERETLASRYKIVKALLNGELTQREMSEQYGVSIAQITRGSNALKITSIEFRKKIKRKMGK